MPQFKITEDHQRALETFLTEIPESGQVKSMIDGSKTLKSPFKKADLDALKGVIENPTFTKYTGYTHKGLLEKWLDPKQRLTTCNEFCTKCGNAMGYKAADKNDGVGRFDIADYLTRYGRGHCWVPASSGAVPEYGDIFREYEPSPDHNGVAKNHMGVSLGVFGNTWYTVESGQAGPSSGYDAIERKTRTWKPSSLQGWVSMSALLGAGNRAPYWLGGWWEVEEGPYEKWYYYFQSPNKVIFTAYPPASIYAPPANGPVVGSFALKTQTGYELTIKWNDISVDEKLTLVIQDQDKRKFLMEGKTADGRKLKAKRMMVTGLL